MQFLKCGDGIFITASIEVDRPQLHDPIIRIVWVEPHGLVHDLNALRCTPRKAETLAEVIENIRIIRIELQSPLICGYGAIMVSANVSPPFLLTSIRKASSYHYKRADYQPDPPRKIACGLCDYLIRRGPLLAPTNWHPLRAEKIPSRTDAPDHKRHFGQAALSDRRQVVSPPTLVHAAIPLPATELNQPKDRPGYTTLQRPLQIKLHLFPHLHERVDHVAAVTHQAGR